MEEEIEDHRQQVFAELEEIRKENSAEINLHFKKLGYPPLDETELLKNSRLPGYDGYGVHP